MPDFLLFGFMQRAFAAGAVMAVVCPLIGVFLVPRRLSLIADTLAHVALAGVAIGLLVGASPVLGALVVTVAGAFGMERLRSRGALQGDAALAVFLSGGFALAVVLISLARGFNADLFAILFGSILTVSLADVWLITALGAVVVTTILLFYRRLFAITVEMGAKTVALRVKVAETSEQGAAGFQCSTPQEIQQTLILFDFGQEAYTQFHMQNVPAPLDIAFVKADGNIFSILKMEPSPTALYGPMGNFRYALEARAGFYESLGARQGEARLLIPAAK